MRHDGYCSDTFVATTTHRHRKRREICRSFTCISPWFLFSRWFKGGTSRGSRNGFMERKWKKEKIGGDFEIKRNSGMLKCSINHEPSSSSREDDVSDNCSAECDKDASLNLGVGFDLISLVAASRNELNKMVKLHNEIELLLQNVQNHDNNKSLFKPSNSKSRISSSYSNTCVQETLYAEEHDPGQTLEDPEIIIFSSGRYRREKSLRMDQLEAELGDEFERLQLQMDEQFYVKNSKHQFSEINVEDSAPEESHSEVVNEHHECSYNEFYGVSPRELERKLHELLESRQEERIIELEATLEYAMQQLEEKEVLESMQEETIVELKSALGYAMQHLEERENELSWWKDTARLVSQHLSDMPSLFKHAKQPHFCSEEMEFDPTVDGKSLVRNVVCDNRAKLKVGGPEV